MQTAVETQKVYEKNEQGFPVVLTSAELVELFTGRLVGRYQETVAATGEDVDAYLDSHPALIHIIEDHRIYIRLAVECLAALAALESVRAILKIQGIEDDAEAQSVIPTDYWYD